MKKLIILLVVAYAGVIAYEYYRKVQTVKIWNDEKWQYVVKVTYGEGFESILGDIRKWKGDVRIQVRGDISKADVENLNLIISEIKNLIAPQKIYLSNNMPNILIRFQGTEKEKYIGSKGTYSKYELNYRENFFDYSFRSISYYYSVQHANIFIKNDSTTTSTQRKMHLLKCISSALIDYHHGDNYSSTKYPRSGEFNKEGINVTSPNYSTLFKQSIFNSFCKECPELTPIDKFIIKTYYSGEFEEKLNAHAYCNYIMGSRKFFLIEIAIITLLFIICYFAGYLEHVFSFADNKIRIKWLAFNCKILFSTVLFSICYSITGYITNITYASGLPSILIHIGGFRFISPLVFWLTFILIPFNCVYLIEKVLFPKFNQFIQQQFFSLIALIASVYFLIYLFYLVRGEKLDLWWVLLGISASIGIARFANNYSNYQKRLTVIDSEQEIVRLRELKTRAELNALQSKINPHFLYNALNSIAGLAHENANKVEQMALALSKLFRYSINKEDDDFTTVQNEVEMVSIYLDIEKVRFGDKLQYQVSLPKELEKERIPKFIIQPLVENGIKHGISQITRAGLLTLEISKSDTSLKIMVSDNGPDFPEDLMTGYGLQNIYEKLDILYPKRYEVTLQNGSKKNISVTLKNA